MDWNNVIASALGEYIAFLAGIITVAFVSKNAVRELVITAVETCVKATKRDYKERLSDAIKKQRDAANKQ